MKKTLPLTRRGFLRGPGAFTLALPYLPSLPLISSNAFAQSGEKPRRLFIMINPHPPKNQHVPKGGYGRGFQMPETHEPLAKYKNKCLIFSNINMQTARDSNGNPHARASAQILTGNRSGGGDGLQALSESVDQYVAKKIERRAVESIVAGIVSRTSASHYFLAKGPTGNNLPFQNNPGDILNTLFKGFNPGSNSNSAANTPRVDRHMSVVDLVVEDYKSLRNKLSAEDKPRLDIHIESLFQLEQDLLAQKEFGSSQGASNCSLPQTEKVDIKNVAEVTPYHWQVARMGFACDRTRVMMISQDGARSGYDYSRHVTGIPGGKGLHGVSHNDPSGANLTKVRKWFAGHLVKFLDMLEETEDIDGSSMLDNTLLLWAGEIGSAADKHIMDGHVFTIFGGKNMGLDLGQHINGGGRNHNDVLTTVIQAMGLPDKAFGPAKYNKGRFESAFL